MLHQVESEPLRTDHSPEETSLETSRVKGEVHLEAPEVSTELSGKEAHAEELRQWLQKIEPSLIIYFPILQEHYDAGSSVF